MAAVLLVVVSPLCADTVDSPSSSASAGGTASPVPNFSNLQEIFLRVRTDLNDRFRFHVLFDLLPVSLVSVYSKTIKKKKKKKNVSNSCFRVFVTTP